MSGTDLFVVVGVALLLGVCGLLAWQAFYG